MPCIRILVGSKTFLFLVVTFLQIDSCFAIRSGAKNLPQTLHSFIPGGGEPFGRGAGELLGLGDGLPTTCAEKSNIHGL